LLSVLDWELLASFLLWIVISMGNSPIVPSRGQILFHLQPHLMTSIDHQYNRVRKALQLFEEAVIHSLRHTVLTRLCEYGVDIFTSKNIAGRSSATVSKKYVHPSSELMERAFVKLKEYSEKARRSLPAAISAT
jgi:hypothetical protein